MPFISIANVACGFHASDPSVMHATVRLALAHGVKVGAHPSLPDRQGFGPPRDADGARGAARSPDLPGRRAQGLPGGGRRAPQPHQAPRRALRHDLEVRTLRRGCGRCRGGLRRAADRTGRHDARHRLLAARPALVARVLCRSGIRPGLQPHHHARARALRPGGCRQAHAPRDRGGHGDIGGRRRCPDPCRDGVHPFRHARDRCGRAGAAGGAGAPYGVIGCPPPAIAMRRMAAPARRRQRHGDLERDARRA
ncbi:5-oxoprolinase subunit A [Geodia barretti]|nr:5-oxoprolinase subunit A [Geodia barretti]